MSRQIDSQIDARPQSAWQHPEWTPGRRATLIAVMEQILPLPDCVEVGGPTDRDSVQAATAAYVARTMIEERLAGHLPLVLAALDELDELAGRDHSDRQGFADLTGDSRETLLRRLEADSNAYLSHAVNLLVQLGLEGYLGDPERGGNPEGVGWRSIGLTEQGPGRRLSSSE